MPWLALAAAALVVAFFLMRRPGEKAFNGFDAMRELVDRHRDLSRAIAVERVRAKDTPEPDPEALARVAAMEAKRKALGESVQKVRETLLRRGFGVAHFWLPSVEQFEAEALAEHERAKASGAGS